MSRELTKRAKQSMLHTYYNCLQYNPLGYDDVINKYYTLLLSFTNQGRRCYVYKTKQGYKLFVDGKTYTREMLENDTRGTSSN